jgi:ATPase subunit of ABC transporter with duplicated ATPase domains
MELIVARNLTIESSGRVLLREADLTLRSGRHLGLVGPNGGGKSTLLRVLAGLEPPAAGTVRRAPGIVAGYLPQGVNWDESQSAWDAALRGLDRVLELERGVRSQERLLAKGASDDQESALARYAELQDLFERAGGYGAQARLQESLASLGIDEERLALPVADLSGGERARLALARLLAGNPDVLLLDEPSNHLDLPALSWLGRRLAGWPGGLVLVSHDRALLDEVCTDTAELKSGTLRVSRGGFTKLRERQGTLLRSRERQLRERRKEAERLERTAAELRAWGTAKAQRRRRRVERELSGIDTRGEAVTEIARPRLEAREASGTLIEAHGLRKVVGARVLIEDADLRIRAGEKVALLGANGSGKSTLLRMLAGEIPSDDPRSEFWWHRDTKLLHADQENRGLRDGQSVGDQLAALVSDERANMLLSLCGLDPERRGATPAQLSGGEQARAGLAMLLAAQANLLLLDEPTNDLDLNAIETLHHALETTEAALVLATHDRALAAIAERVWALENGELVEYRGGLEGYLAGRRRREPGLDEAIGEAAEPSTPTDASDSETGAAGAAASELERLELERLGIEARLADPLDLTDRERERLTLRLREIIDDLSLHYDRPLPRPAPTFSVREGGVRLEADFSAEGLEYHSEAPARLRLVVDEGVGHLVMSEEEGSVLLPWARGALLDGAVRLAFYALAPNAVQHHSRAPFYPRFLEPGSDGWWSISRDSFERLEGWYRVPASTGRRARRRRGRRRGAPSRGGAGAPE